MKSKILILFAAVLGLVACQKPENGETIQFSVPETTFNLKCEAQTLKVTVNTTVACKVELSGGADAWLHQQTKYSDDIIKEKGITFSVDENKGAERAATVVITPVSGDAVTVSVEQEAASFINTILTLTVADQQDVKELEVSLNDKITVVPVTNLGPAEAGATISFSSSDDKIVKFLGNGEFEAVGVGSVDIKAAVAEKAGAYSAAEAIIKVSVRGGMAVWDMIIDSEYLAAHSNDYGYADAVKVYEAPGFNGIKVPANIGSGNWQYYMVDREGTSGSAVSSYKLAAKGIDIVAPIPGDYVLWTVGEDTNYGAGTQFEFSCDEFQSAGQNAIWTIEYLDGDKWVAPAEYPVSEVKDAAAELGVTVPEGVSVAPFKYNIINPSGAAQNIKFVATLKNATKGIQIRQTSMTWVRASKVYAPFDTNSGNSFLIYTEKGQGKCSITVL